LRDGIGELGRCNIVVNKGNFFLGLKLCKLWVCRKNVVDKTLRMTIQIVELQRKRKMQHRQCIISWIWHITIDVWCVCVYENLMNKAKLQLHP
jgi:hypothetical protein